MKSQSTLSNKGSTLQNIGSKSSTCKKKITPRLLSISSFKPSSSCWELSQTQPPTFVSGLSLSPTPSCRRCSSSRLQVNFLEVRCLSRFPQYLFQYLAICRVMDRNAYHIWHYYLHGFNGVLPTLAQVALGLVSE